MKRKALLLTPIFLLVSCAGSVPLIDLETAKTRVREIINDCERVDFGAVSKAIRLQTETILYRDGNLVTDTYREHAFQYTSEPYRIDYSLYQIEKDGKGKTTWYDDSTSAVITKTEDGEYLIDDRKYDPSRDGYLSNFFDVPAYVRESNSLYMNPTLDILNSIPLGTDVDPDVIYNTLTGYHLTSGGLGSMDIYFEAEGLTNYAELLREFELPASSSLTSIKGNITANRLNYVIAYFENQNGNGTTTVTKTTLVFDYR